MAIEPGTLRIYSAPDGSRPFEKWLEGLKDYDAQARILVRLGRVRLGSLGDWKPVGEGVGELRVPVGPGHRVYFGQDGALIVILLCGGSKATQHKDIANAKRYWQDFRNRKNAPKRFL